MVKRFLLSILCLYAFKSNADAPGKRAMSESRISIKNITRLTGYDFYWKFGDNAETMVTEDTSVSLPGSGGAPYNAIFWAINKASNTSTDTLHFENYYAPDFEVTIDTIVNNKFRYQKKEIANNNAGGIFDGDKNGTGSRSTTIYVLAGISLLALILLVWFFMKKKNSSQIN